MVDDRVRRRQANIDQIAKAEQARQTASELRDLLGAKLTAYVAGTGLGTEARLRAALEAANILGRRDSPAVIQVWFQGTNAALGDIAPARLLRESDPDVSGQLVIEAAASHVSA